MRLDKYLKVSRLIKRRTVAKDAALADLIMINDKVVKPASTVKPGDILTLHFGLKILTVKVVSIDIPRPKSEEVMFELISETKKS